MTPKAKFLCSACGSTWEKAPGPTHCENCGYLYVNWLNYAEFTSPREYELIFPGRNAFNTVE